MKRSFRKRKRPQRIKEMILRMLKELIKENQKTRN